MDMWCAVSVRLTCRSQLRRRQIGSASKVRPNIASPYHGQSIVQCRFLVCNPPSGAGTKHASRHPTYSTTVSHRLDLPRPNEGGAMAYQISIDRCRSTELTPGCHIKSVIGRMQVARRSGINTSTVRAMNGRVLSDVVGGTQCSVVNASVPC